jgi:DNA polymerase III epsilon subunit-like protein
VRAYSFADDDREAAWLLADVAADRAAHHRAWGDYAVLYRKHTIGDLLEGECLKAGIPCRLAHGRALADDRIVQYVLAALRVIAQPTDSVHAETFLQVVLPPTLLGELRTEAEQRGTRLLAEAERRARSAPKAEETARKIRRAQAALRNLPALGVQHSSLGALIEELLSQRVGPYRSVLEDNADEITDPADDAEVQAIADKIEAARREGRPLTFAPMGGIEIALAGMVSGAGLRRLLLERPGVAPECIGASDAPALGVGLALFKALQLAASRTFPLAFRDYTAIDLETTGKDLARAEIVELAAVRVRDGAIVDEWHTLVKPSVAIDAEASATHGISDADVLNAPSFGEVWPRLAEFARGDVLVAHNGYDFDFPLLRRMAKSLGHAWRFRTYDTLPLAREVHAGSRRLADLAHVFDVAAGRSHRALDDTRTLVPVFDGLSRLKLQRARKSALANVLDHLGVALALSPSLGAEAQRFADWARPFALGRFSDAIDWYRARRDALAPSLRDALPSAEDVIDRLGGHALMLKIRAEKSADQRYPIAMARLRRLIETIEEEPLADQITRFLERAVLSRNDGVEPDRDRVNLLTLHSTKGLEFSRVYIAGVEDAEFLNGTLEQTSEGEAEEARRLLYVGMTRTIDRLVMTRAELRQGESTGGYRFLTEMGLEPDAEPDSR